MSTASQSANPFEWWLQANLSMMSASVELARSTTTAVATAMTQIPSGAGAFARPATTAVESPPQRPAPMGASERPRGRSWYRAPYRSPFDPMFWMMPGHPVDHMGDWIAPAMTAAQMSFANPYASAVASSLSSHPSTSWMMPMMAWTNFLSPTGGAGQALTSANSNVVDFEKAYAAYRTAGGHATAQIIRDGITSLTQPAAMAPTLGPASIWAMMFPMLPWLR